MKTLDIISLWSAHTHLNTCIYAKVNIQMQNTYAQSLSTYWKSEKHSHGHPPEIQFSTSSRPSKIDASISGWGIQPSAVIPGEGGQCEYLKQQL